jgi:hypothetical protein
MPLNNESLSAHTREEFCDALKAERERKAISLAAIAEKTKIPASLFEALERNDLRRWPKGLFRRSFFRDYARVVGLPAEWCAAFVRLFPDDGSAPVAVVEAAGAAGDDEPDADVRLVLDAEWHGPRAPVLPRLLIAVSDAMVVAAVSAVAWLAGADVPWITAIFAVAYFSIATALFGETPASRTMSRRRDILEALTPLRVVVAAFWRGGADAISQGFTAADDAVPEPEPRLRVRIKVPQ